MRHTLGIAVFSGMLGVTLFGIFLTPVFYFVIQWASDRRAAAQARARQEEEEQEQASNGQARHDHGEAGNGHFGSTHEEHAFHGDRAREDLPPSRDDEELFPAGAEARE